MAAAFNTLKQMTVKSCFMSSVLVPASFAATLAAPYGEVARAGAQQSTCQKRLYRDLRIQQPIARKRASFAELGFLPLRRRCATAASV